jgi:hypothetical protein
VWSPVLTAIKHRDKAIAALEEGSYPDREPTEIGCALMLTKTARCLKPNVPLIGMVERSTRTAA